MMISDVAACSPVIARQWQLFREGLDDCEFPLHRRIEAFLNSFSTHHALGAEDVAAHYIAFARRYARDLKRFGKDPVYPMRADAYTDTCAINRLTYDCFLIVSALITPHRFRLIRNVEAGLVLAERCLIIGVGSGLELHLASSACNTVTAYDMELGSYLRVAFPNVDFRESRFTGDEKEAYDLILAVELLEHVEDPFTLLGAMRGRLSRGGRMIVTTARNVPQFDHMFNFTDPRKLDREAEALGLSILSREVIHHEYMLSGIDADNVVYLLQG